MDNHDREKINNKKNQSLCCVYLQTSCISLYLEGGKVKTLPVLNKVKKPYLNLFININSFWFLLLFQTGKLFIYF